MQLNEALTFERLTKELEYRQLPFAAELLEIVTNDGLGLLVSDQCRHMIQFAIFQGTDSLVCKQRKEFTGSLVGQVTDTLKEIDFYNGTKATFHDLLRVDTRDYPEEAIREALLNAVVHREYALSGSININLYADRLEMISLGGLVPGMSLEAAKIGASQARNEKLANLFYRMKLIEAYGTGISKIVNCYKGLAVQPQFDSVPGAFRVTLPNVNADVAYEEDGRYEAIRRLLQEKKEITRSDVEAHLAIKTTYAVKLLKEMLTKDYIIKVGSGRTTKYKLK